MHLTKKQKQILDYIESHINTEGYAPSIQEIGAHFGLSSPATTHKHLTNLEAKGLIKRQKNLSRAIEMPSAMPPVPSSVEVPLLGYIAAGEPLTTYPMEEMVSIPEDMVGRNNTYVLKVKGESMIDEQIRDGDYVVVEERNHADNGETAVALVDNESVTLKKFYRENGSIRLQPANETMEPLVLDSERVAVQGVVIGLLRKF